MAKEHGEVSLKELEASGYRTGQSPVIDLMVELGIPLTRERYLEISFPDGYSPHPEITIPKVFAIEGEISDL